VQYVQRNEHVDVGTVSQLMINTFSKHEHEHEHAGEDMRGRTIAYSRWRKENLTICRQILSFDTPMHLPFLAQSALQETMQ